MRTHTRANIRLRVTSAFYKRKMVMRKGGRPPSHPPPHTLRGKVATCATIEKMDRMLTTKKSSVARTIG